MSCPGYCQTLTSLLVYGTEKSKKNKKKKNKKKEGEKEKEKENLGLWASKSDNLSGHNVLWCRNLSFVRTVCRSARLILC